MVRSMTGRTERLAYCELHFPPEVQLVTLIRRFIEAFYLRLAVDRATTERLALATHELLENAMRYASGGETRIRVEVDLAATPWTVAVRTWNRTSPEHRADLEARVRRLDEASDTFALYQELMLEASVRQSGSGLGLARVRAEAEMALRCEAEEDRVCIVAETTASATGVAA
jgi:anti-sigma regulatory factor (Ser/Thr protein kinase)